MEINNTNTHTIRTAPGYPNIDIAKFICSFLIVFIHTAPLKNISEIADFFTAHVLARVAVPLFFAISGFLFFSKLEFENGKIAKTAANFKRMLRYWKSSAILYFGWSAFYIVFAQIPLWYRIGWWGTYVIKDCICSIFFTGSYYHLWYLLTLVYAIPILFFVLQRVNWRAVGILSVFLWLCECLVYSYSWLGIDGIPLFGFVNSRLPILLHTTFRAIPLLVTGLVLSQWKPNMKGASSLWAAAIAFLLCAAEATILRFFTPNSGMYSYLFFTPFLAFTCLLVLIGENRQISVPHPWVLRKSSLVIYCVHPIIINHLNHLGVTAGIPLFFATTVLSLLAALVWCLISKKIGSLNKPRNAPPSNHSLP